jgi:hypothetical protein
MTLERPNFKVGSRSVNDWLVAAEALNLAANTSFTLPLHWNIIVHVPRSSACSFLILPHCLDGAVLQ